MDDLGQSCLGIKEWYSPDDSSQIEADIVAVHGFAANPFWTWVGKPKEQKTRPSAWTNRLGNRQSPSNDHQDPERPSEQPVNWLQQFLPKFAPKSRIVTFGYQSDYFRSAPKRDVDNCAQELLLALVRSRAKESEKRRPIIFIGHSFGGIVIKEALIKATLAAQHFGLIKESTHGIIFLGTPHRGASIALYGETLVTIAKAVGFGSDTGLIRNLREKSPELLKLATNFSDIYNNFEIFCFYELLPWKFSSVVVEQASAVIEGRLSVGLTVNHSGLNKYTSDQDPNLIMIAKVVAGMVHSSRSKIEHAANLPKAATPVARRPWEIAASLVCDIEHAFDTVIKTFQARKKEQRDTETLLVQKYRFQSWAYAIGLITMLGARQPLHERLGGAVCNDVCSLLEQILQALDMEKRPQSAEEPVFSVRTASATLQKLFQQLAALFPEKDRGIMRHAFISRVLAPDNDEATFESLAENPVSQSFPDLEAIAAMKRIMILSEQSEAKRPSEERLVIQIRELTFDKTKSSSRSTGVFKHQESGTQHSRQVLVEWKRYEGFWDTQVGNELFQRVELLTEFLKTASRGSEVLDLRLLDCLGYCHDDKKRRLGFVYAIPKSVGSRRSCLRLNALMKEYNEHHLYPPSVGDRMQLAKLLCKAMFDFHRAEWFHKSFSSYNILLFPEVDALDAEDSKTLEVSNYSVLTPYIVGFNNSRPSKPNEFSEPAKTSNELRRYWHPDYKNVPMQKYRHEFDYYSLGIVLLEVGRWSPLSTFMKEFEEQDAAKFADTVRNSSCLELSSFIGSIYQRVVADLLEAFHEGKDRAERNELASLGELIEFQTRILEQLGQCKA
ncbi:hypothetical protein V496_00117 [Pseudogymnoascus sp. VKM F-4515 (FW-2607)]|nr:hypothetical protein V496_00117 [Pseudogymnoascus sp. VKM F-4515 (FW-2607)]